VSGPDVDTRLIGALLRAPSQAVVRYIHRAFADAGYDELRPAHMPILMYVDHPPGGTRITDLAERAQMTKQSMGQLVAEMERLGVVELVADPSDRRAKIVRYTERGWEMHETAIAIGKRLEADWSALIGVENFAELRRLLKLLIASLDG
jgi:DNA-binding MarR family transcriptional regulator